jgi:hypothetical protein
MLFLAVMLFLVRWPSTSTGVVWLTEQRERRCQPGKRSWPPH